MRLPSFSARAVSPPLDQRLPESYLVAFPGGADNAILACTEDSHLCTPRKVETPTEEVLVPWADQVYEWLTADRLQVTRIRSEVERSWLENDAAVSTISFWEVGMQVQKGRLDFDLDLDAWRRDLLDHGLVEVPVDGGFNVPVPDKASRKPSNTSQSPTNPGSLPARLSGSASESRRAAFHSLPSNISRALLKLGSRGSMEAGFISPSIS